MDGKWSKEEEPKPLQKTGQASRLIGSQNRIINIILDDTNLVGHIKRIVICSQSNVSLLTSVRPAKQTEKSVSLDIPYFALEQKKIEHRASTRSKHISQIKLLKKTIVQQPNFPTQNPKLQHHIKQTSSMFKMSTSSIDSPKSTTSSSHQHRCTLIPYNIWRLSLQGPGTFLRGLKCLNTYAIRQDDHRIQPNRRFRVLERLQTHQLAANYLNPEQLKDCA